MRNRTLERLIWLGAGSCVGMAFGILLAPASGLETRRRIGTQAESARELYQKGRQLADEAAEMFAEGQKLMEGESGGVRYS